MEYNKIKMTFNNYTQKARLTLLNIHREEVEVNIHQCRTEPEANNCFSIILRGEYQGLQNILKSLECDFLKRFLVQGRQQSF